ncbi:MAG TPA: Gfo/Idh/MocA family oxidoreductase [Devosia sp.]|nr:Gfo/Idh/MocA family oxidoreductase [Devosia sp.]
MNRSGKEAGFSGLRQVWPMPAHPKPVVIIGAGGIVRDAHLPAYRKWGIPVAGLHDRDRQRAASLAAANDVPRVFDTLDAAIAAGTHIFDIALPPEALRDVLPRLPEGCAALVQKPLGTSLDDARHLIRVLEERNITAALNFQMRFTPSMLAVSDALKRGELGEITDIDVSLSCRTPWEEWPFMKKLEAVEIPLHSIHYLDWIAANAGLPRAVYARSVPHPEHPDLADARSSIILDYDRPVRCSLSLNHVHKWGSDNERAEMRIEGTKGAAIVGLGYNVNFPLGRPETLLMVRKGGSWRTVTLEGARVPDSFAFVMANLQRYLAGEDTQLPTGLDSSLRTMALVQACLNSSRTRRAVELDSVGPPGTHMQA